MSTRVIREPEALYAALEDTQALKQGPIFIEKDGHPQAVLLSIDEYRALTAQRDFDAWRQEQLHQTQADHEAFERMLPDLLKEHRGEWAAFHQGQVVGVGKDFRELVHKMRDGGYPTFYIQKIQTAPRVIELPFEVTGRV